MNENTNVPDKIIVHHSAYKSDDNQFQLIDGWHKDRQFLLSSLGYYVGYHYVIEKDGIVVRAKEDNEEGCHTIGQNLTSIGICLAGNFDVELPSKAQIKSLGKLLVELTTKYDIPASFIVPHRTYASKTCFGNKLESAWAQLVCIGHKETN